MQDKLGDKLANDPRIMSNSENYDENLMYSVAVIKSVILRRAELMRLHQDHDKPLRNA